jgi:hypothetical protein
MIPAWAKSAVERDTKMAKDLEQAARKASAAGYYVPGTPPIADGVRPALLELASDSRRALESALALPRTLPFFRRVTVLSNAGNEERTYCVTNVRSVASISNHTDESYTAIGWSSPLAAQLPAKVGERFADLYRDGREWQIVAQARYTGHLLPAPFSGRVEDRAKLYELVPEVLSGVEDEGSVGARTAKRTARQRREPTTEKGRSRGGLVNIAASADHEQWTSFHHDLKGNVLVEGPPGSGKTSVALMRIPCLIDRQWDELSIRKGVDLPRYSEERTLVVIANRALLSTLRNLMQDLGLRSVLPRDLQSVLKELLAAVPHLQPREFRAPTDAEAVLGHEGRFLGLLEFGLYQHALLVSESLPPGDLRGPVTRGAAQSLKTRLVSWAESIRDGRRAPLAKSLAEWVRQWTNESARNGSAIKKSASEVVRSVFDRRAILRVMFERSRAGRRLGPELQEWHDSWRASEAAASLGEWCAWGALRCRLFSNDDENPRLAASTSVAPPTHIVVDEAQDVGLSEFQFLRARLAEGGVMTLSGDPSQAERVSGAKMAWSAVRADDFHRVSLGVNYRQSRAIGEFVREVFAALYQRNAQWRTNVNRRGRPVRVERITEVPLSRLVPHKIVSLLNEFRSEMPDDVLGVIHHGDALLTGRIVERLEASGFSEVRRAEDLAKGVMGEVVVGTAWELRGLEFPAAVVLDLACSGVEDDLTDEKRRNGLYICVSRACELLAVVVRDGVSGKLLARAAARSRE